MIRRREFIAGLGSAAAWPVAARAQQPAVPVIGYLISFSLDSYADRIRAFRQGLGEAGFVEGRNVAIEFRSADDQYDRLPALAADLVHRQVSVIVASDGAAATAAKAVTATIPIVFMTAADPVDFGLVARLNRPGGNLTGVVSLGAELMPKRLELLHELIPAATVMAVLLNPSLSLQFVEGERRVMLAAARTLGVQVEFLYAATERDFDAVFAGLIKSQAGALLIGIDPFLNRRSAQLGALTARLAVPASHYSREFTAAGGLMSYVGNTDGPRLASIYTSRILKGEKPGDLPVQQSTKVELIINLKTAKALGLTISETLLASADEVIQ
jgi:putative ABC transport system substrate-binding protein